MNSTLHATGGQPTLSGLQQVLERIANQAETLEGLLIKIRAGDGDPCLLDAAVHICGSLTVAVGGAGTRNEEVAR